MYQPIKKVENPGGFGAVGSTLLKAFSVEKLLYALQMLWDFHLRREFLINPQNIYVENTSHRYGQATQAALSQL